MKSYYQLIQKASYEFTAKNHFAPNVIYMNERVYSYLLHETYGNAWWILVHDRRILGLKIVLSYDTHDFRLE